MEKRENFSRKRMAILEALQGTTVHPTADWVFSQLKPKYPDLSLGTVYRNLKKFCETGKAASVGVINGQEHFDGNTAPHVHFICEGCGTVLDVGSIDVPIELTGQAEAATGGQVTACRLSFTGRCPSCKPRDCNNH